MKITKGFVTVLLLSFSSLVQANYCSDIDLRNETLGENRNQKDVSWCYAYTAADMIAHKYNLNRVSASDVAINYNDTLLARGLKQIFNLYYIFADRDSIKMEHQYGFIALALRKILKEGVCLEEDFASEYMVRVDEKNGKQIKTRVDMKQAMFEIRKLRKQLRLTPWKKPTFWFEVKGVDRSEFYRLVRFSAKTKLFMRLVNRACENRFYPDSKATVKYFVKGKRTFDRINQQLDRGNLVGVDFWTNMQTNFTGKKTGLHANTVVARRWNSSTNKCEYLMRDSYGNTCDHFDSRLECEAGNVWMPEDIFERYIVDISYIE
jgi:hypothetical protein